MLATKPGEGEHKYWSFDKFTSLARKSPGSRMSNQYLNSLSTQPNWRGHYTYGNGESDSLASSSPRNSNSSLEAQKQCHKLASGCEDHSLSVGSTVKSLPGFEDIKLEDSQPKSLHTLEQGAPTGTQAPVRNVSPVGVNTEGCRSSGRPLAKSPVQDELQKTLSIGSASNEGHENVVKDEDMDVTDEDDMLDTMEDDGARQRMAADRSAAKRKMKRFRLNHQQTRFLMSEFVKQPHPDATHRERLSQQIPGLSPRQVQVWFQNRRAKIKRLNVNDRERVIQMRAVPDNFDNVRALHSPYGAVQGVGRPFAQHDMSSQPFRNNNMRPLIVDVQRSVAGTQSPTSLTPSLGGFGFPRSNVTTPDVLSPLSSASNDRYSFSSAASSPYGVGHGLSHGFLGQQHSFENTASVSRSAHTLQPLSLRDPLIRTRGETMHSPLQSAMSWKVGSLDYSGCQELSSSHSESRHQSRFLNSTLSQGFYDGGQYVSSAPGYGVQSRSPTTAATTADYPDVHHSPLNRPRMRAASATLPLSSEFSDQPRSAAADSPPPSQHVTSRQISLSSSISSPSICTTSYPSAPLATPTDYPSKSPRKTSPRNMDNAPTLT